MARLTDMALEQLAAGHVAGRSEVVSMASELAQRRSHDRELARLAKEVRVQARGREIVPCDAVCDLIDFIDRMSKETPNG